MPSQRDCVLELGYIWTIGHLSSCGRRKESCPSNSEAESLRSVPASASSPTQRHVNFYMSYGTKSGCWEKTHARTHAHKHTHATTRSVQFNHRVPQPCCIRTSSCLFDKEQRQLLICISCKHSWLLQRTELCLRAQVAGIVILDSAESLNNEIQNLGFLMRLR